jgi:hypothetical protein
MGQTLRQRFNGSTDQQTYDVVGFVPACFDRYSPWAGLDSTESGHQIVATVAKTAGMSKLDHHAFSGVNDMMIHSLRPPPQMSAS